jgi:hypothetical protein
MNDNIFFAAFFFPSIAAVLVFFMKYLSAIMQSRARLAQDGGYREIATTVAASQAEIAALLGAIQAQLAGIEKILSAVE